MPTAVLSPFVKTVEQGFETVQGAVDNVFDAAESTAELPQDVVKRIVDAIINFREFWGNVGKRGVEFIKKYDSPTELSGQAALDLIRALESLDKEDAKAIADLEERYAKDPKFKTKVDASRAAIEDKANEYADKSEGKYSSDEVIDAGVVTVAYLYFVVRDLLENTPSNLNESYDFIKGMLPHIERLQFKSIIKSAQGAFNSTETPEEKQEYIVNICKGLVVLNKPLY